MSIVLDIPELLQVLPDPSLTIQEVELPCHHQIYLRLYKNVQNGEELIELIRQSTKNNNSNSIGHNNIGQETDGQSKKKTLIDCLMLDASMIYDLKQVQLACTRAKFLKNHNYMKTKSLYTEILYNLSPETKIGEAIKNFGLKTVVGSHVLVLVMLDQEMNEENCEHSVVGDDKHIVSDNLRLRLLDDAFDALIQGDRVILKRGASSFEAELKEIRDSEKIKKIYALDDDTIMNEKRSTGYDNNRHGEDGNGKIILPTFSAQDLILGAIAIKGYNK